MKTLKLYNTASRKKEIFTTRVPSQVSMYCCGPTVYNYAHIGNLRTYIFEDLLRRTLEYAGYQVKHAVNITDVGHLTSDADTGEDKLEKGAAREGRSVWDIAQTYTEEFWKDWKLLNLKEPHIWPKATDHIAEQIHLVQDLEKKGHTYLTSDGVYFDTSTFPRYGNFAHLDIANLEAGKRIALSDEKRNPTDFALWKFSPKDHKRAMEWESPWGVGFPGWHVECSAMALKHLGETLDIHCGGTDHIRVHHTNEIAQSECHTGKEFATFWIHGGWLLEEKEEGKGSKMSKSSGEFVRLQTLIEQNFDPMDYRFFCMSSHYRNYLSFSWKNLEAARNGRQNLLQKLKPYLEVQGKIESATALGWQSKFWDSVSDDLNIPMALGVLNTMLKDPDLLPTEKGALIANFDTVLGLKFSDALEQNIPQDDHAELKLLIQERQQARLNKDFARADQIRKIFEDKGLVLKDSPQGTIWEKKN